MKISMPTIPAWVSNASAKAKDFVAAHPTAVKAAAVAVSALALGGAGYVAYAAIPAAVPCVAKEAVTCAWYQIGCVEQAAVTCAPSVAATVAKFFGL